MSPGVSLMFEFPLGVYSTLTALGVLTACVQQTPVGLDDVPVAVVEAARGASDGATLEGADRALRPDRAFWLVTGRDGRGLPLRIELKPTGEVWRVSTQILPTDLPPKLLQNLNARGLLDGVQLIWDIRKPALGEQEYQFFGQLPGGGFGMKFASVFQDAPRR